MLFLGIDGGGSKTAALLVDHSGEVVGRGSGGGANYHVLGIETTIQSIKAAVNMALEGRVPDAICYCLAGADAPYDFSQLEQVLSQHLDFACPWSVRNDVIGIFRAGSRFPYGIAVVSGTGFNAGGISKDGRECRLAALGLVTGDRAGGARLGENAVGAAFRSWDGRGEPTLLADAILEALGVGDFESLMDSLVRKDIGEKQINRLAPVVFDLSEQGDPVARRLIKEQATELGTAANAILRKLDLEDEDCDVVLGGGIFQGKGNLLIDTVRSMVRCIAPRAIVKRLTVPPVVGATLLAADLLSAEISEGFSATLNDTVLREH